MATGGLLLRLLRDERVYEGDFVAYLAVGALLVVVALGIAIHEASLLAFGAAIAIPFLAWLHLAWSRCKLPVEVQLFEKALRLRWRRLFGGSLVQEISCDDVSSIRSAADRSLLHSSRFLIVELSDGRKVDFQIVKARPHISRRWIPTFDFVIDWNSTEAPFAVVDGVPNHVDVFAKLLLSLCPRCAGTSIRGPLW